MFLLSFLVEFDNKAVLYNQLYSTTHSNIIVMKIKAKCVAAIMLTRDEKG